MTTHSAPKRLYLLTNIVLAGLLAIIVAIVGMKIYKAAHPDVDLFTIPNPSAGLKQRQPLKTTVPALDNN